MAVEVVVVAGGLEAASLPSDPPELKNTLVIRSGASEISRSHSSMAWSLLKCQKEVNYSSLCI
ncbi:hypothetical protein [Arthrobacter sp. D2-10]